MVLMSRLRPTVFLLLVAIVIMPTGIFALKLSVPENVPEGTSFAAVASISESGFDEIRVLLDDKVVFTQKLGLEANTEYIAYYKEYSPSGDKRLVLLLNPLKAGKYDLEVRLIAGNSTKSKDSVTINVFRVASTSYVDSVSRDISSVKSEFNALKSEINSLKDRVSSVETKLSNNEADITSIKAELQSISESLSEVDVQLDQLRESLSSIDESIKAHGASLSETKSKYNDLSGQLNSINERLAKTESKLEERQMPALGFLTLENSAIFLALVLVVTAIFLALSVAKKRNRRRSLFETEEHKDTGEVLEDVITEETQTGGRWAYKGDKKEGEPEEKKRFSLGDLIRRK